MRSTAFVKITVVYGQIAENGSSVRKWPARKMPITDKMVKNGRLSVNPPHNDQKFTDKSPKNDGLSVKCVLITDKSAKMGTLSVNLYEILTHRPEQKNIRFITARILINIQLYGAHERSLPHLVVIGFQLAFPLSQARTP